MRTKKYTKEENVQSTDVKIELESTGNAKIDFERKYTGLELENENFISQLTQSESEKRKWILDKADYGNLQLESYKFFDITGDVVPESGYKVKGSLPGFGSSSTGRLFVRPFVFTNLHNLRLPQSERVNPIVIKYPFTHIDTLVIKYPSGYEIEKSFPAYQVETKFGKYIVSFKEEGEILYFTRKLILNEGRYPKEDYTIFREFINEIQKKDKDQIVFIKKTP